MNWSLFKPEPCVAPVWSQGGHAQTLWGYFLPSIGVHDARAERLEIPLEGGDRLIGARYAGSSDTVVHVFHGLGGDIESSYMRRTARVVLGLGHSVHLVNHRGSGEGAGLARGSAHSGRAEDLSQAIVFARRKEPAKKHWAVGFSMSGNALLLLLAGRRGTERPDGALVVNAPIDLEKASRKLTQGFNRLYDLNFVRACRRDLAKRRALGLLDRDYRVPFAASIRDFDELFTAPANGFRDRADYYSSCSAKSLLAEIKTPTLVITAKDDPFVDWTDYRDARISPSTHVHIEETGGHMGYLTNKKTPLGTFRWQDYAIHEGLRVLGS